MRAKRCVRQVGRVSRALFTAREDDLAFQNVLFRWRLMLYLTFIKSFKQEKSFISKQNKND